MKKTFSTTFFRRALFLVLLFGGVTNLWGETEVATLSFSYTKVGHPVGQSAPQTCNNFDDKDKVIMDGDFTYSKGNDEIVMGDGYAKINNQLYACTRNAVNLPSGTLKFTIRTKKFEENGKVNTPTISIDGDEEVSYSGGSELSYTKDEVKDLEYTITIEDAGNHDIKIKLPSAGKKFGVYDLKITSTGGPTCEAPTISSHPSGATYSQGAPATALSVTASGTSLTYQWQSSSNNSDWSNITNATSASYTPSTSSTGTKYYRCVVTESGECSTNSNSATITVNAATSFTAGQTIFFRSNSEGAWKDNACVITEYSNNWDNKQTADLYWMYNVGNTDYKMFYGIVPSGTYDRVQLHRYAANKCYSTTQGDYWNDAGWVSVDGSKNTFYSKGADKNDGEWYSTNYEMYLKGSINWTPNLATFTDQLNGDFAASYNNFQPSATSYEFRVFDNNGQGFGSSNTTLSGLNTNSTYNITASFNIGSRGTLTLEKTFVKGKVTFNANGRGTAPSALDNVPAGAKIEEPEMAEVNHYYVEGWYKETDCTNKWNFETDEVTESMTLYAKWVAVPQYTITASSADQSKGTVFGDGTYYRGATVTLTATPNDDYGFYQWNDGNTDNPRTITVTGDATYTASFKAMVCTNTLTWEAEDESKMVSPTEVTTCEYYKDKHCDGSDASSLLSDASNSHFISMKQSASADSRYIYYHFSTSGTANLSFVIRASSRYRDKTGYVTLYSTKQSGSQVFTCEGKSYKKVEEFNQTLGGDVDEKWRDLEHTFSAQPADDYIVAVRSSEDYWTIYFDKFTITASDNVFCTEAPAEPDSWHLYIKDQTLDNDLFVDGSKTVTLAKEQTYEFKIVKWVANVESDKVWYTDQNASESSAHMTESNHYDWNFSKTEGGSSNTHIDAAAAGDYTFTINTSGSFPVVSVTYPASYTATFNMQDHGTAPAQQTHLAAGDKVVAPATPADVTGWHFVGWYKEQACTNVFDFANETISNSNVTIYAKWISAVELITIHMEGDTKTNLTIGQTNQLYVTYYPNNAEWGKALRATDPWVAQDASILSVDNTGLVTAKKAGTKKIYAYSIDGKQAEYEITVTAPICTAFYIHYWTSGTGNAGDWCMNKYGDHEWRTDTIQLPSESDNEQLSVGNAGGQIDHCKNWNFNWLPMAGQQSSNCTWDGDNKKAYYAGQDALGYLRLFDNSGEENYYLAFEPIYVAMFGMNDNTFTQVEFSPIATEHTYQSELCKMPNGYKSDSNYKYYVGTKRAEGSSKTPFINNSKSSTDALNGVTGLSGEDWGGKYGKFEMYDNNCNSNFGCIFLPFYTYELRNDDESRFYLAPGCPKNGGTTATTFYSGVPEKTGYTCIGWNQTKGATEAQIVGGSDYNYYDGNDVRYPVWQAKTYTVTLDKGAHGTSDGSATATYDSNTLSITHVGTPVGYTLDGYYTANDGGNKVIAADGTLQANVTDYTDADGKWVKDADCTLYAQWTANQHKVTINLDGGAIEDGTWTQESGSYYKMFNFGVTISLPTPTKAGYTFNAWTPAVPETMPDEDVTLTATWKVDYCSNTLRIDCNRDVVLNETCNPNNESKFGTPESTTGYGLITEGNSGVGNMYFKFSTSANATIQFKVRMGNTWANDDAYMYLYNEDVNGSLEIGGIKYTEASNDNLHKNDHEGYEWVTIDKTVSAGKHILRFYGYNYTIYDVCDLTADASVFCPEMYTVNFAANPSDMGTVTAAIKNGAAISSGDEVPENTVVVFTASGITSGYEVVNWTDGSGNELAGNVTSFEQTITDDITVTANIALIQPKYTVTATAGEHGTISSGENDYPAGANVTIVTAPATNYKVGSATASNVNEFTIDGNNVSFTMPAAAVDVTINFVFDTVHNMIATGTSANIGSKQQYGGGTITMTEQDNASFTHKVLRYDYNINNGDYCGYSLPTDAGYTVNAKATGFAFWFMTNDKVYMEIKANNNPKVFKLPNTNGEWHYIYLEDNAAKTATSFEVWMNYEKEGWSMSNPQGTMYITEIQATNVTSQEPIVPPVDLTVVVSPAGGGTVVTSPATTTGLVKGTPVTLTATPEDNYRFVNWTVGGSEVSTETTYVRTVNATETITANFVRVYTLTITNDGHGTATVSPNQAQFAEGDKFTLTAQPTAGYAFDYYMDGDNKIETDPYEFTMSNSNRTISVHFKENIQYYNIQTDAGDKGIITFKVNGVATDDVSNVLEGSPVEMTVTIKDEYKATAGFVKWQDNNTDNPRTIIANAANAAITWTPEYATLRQVEVSYGKPGSLVTGGGTYATGAQVTLEAFVSDKQYDYEYHFSKWVVESGSAPITGHETENPLHFNMPANNVSIKAIFAPVECVDTFVIQCEDDKYYISANSQEYISGTFPKPIPNSLECGKYCDHYYDAHGFYKIEEETGLKKYYYFDNKGVSDCEMYYIAQLPAAGTYKVEVWTAGDADKHMTLNLYQPSEQNVVLTYVGANYAKTKSAPITFVDNHFRINATIDNIVVTERQRIIIGIYSHDSYGAYDQIRITATNESEPFCHELSTDTCIIKSGETKEIPVCGVKHLIMYDGSQANNEEDADISNSVLYIRNVDNIDEWEDFALPYTADELKVWDAEDKQEYAIKPVVRNNDGTNKKGHFYLQELLDENVTAINAEFRQRWANTDEPYPQANKPYIIKFSTAQNNGYFAGRPVYYRRGGKISLPCKDNAVIENGGWPEQGKPAYYYYANNSLVDIIPYDAYVLNDDHTEFVLTEHPVVKPFHCYIQASEEMKAMAPRLRLVGGGSTPTLIPVVEALNVDAEGVFKFIMDDKVYILRNGVLYNAVGQHVK